MKLSIVRKMQKVNIIYLQYLIIMEKNNKLNITVHINYKNILNKDCKYVIDPNVCREVN